MVAERSSLRRATCRAPSHRVAPVPFLQLNDRRESAALASHGSREVRWICPDRYKYSIEYLICCRTFCIAAFQILISQVNLHHKIHSTYVNCEPRMLTRKIHRL
jgi:hypothetical protein